MKFTKGEMGEALAYIYLDTAEQMFWSDKDTEGRWYFEGKCAGISASAYALGCNYAFERKVGSLRKLEEYITQTKAVRASMGSDPRA